MSTVTSMVAPVQDLWPEDPLPADPLEQLLLASRLLGSNRAVANVGGGNTSVKGVAADHAGCERRVLWVKGSGSDLATLERRQVTALRLDEVEPLIERDEMSDEEMVAYLGRCMIDPAMPRASIETLLHAFVPAAHVHHTHPDAVNVLAGTRDGERLVAECFGAEAAWVPYVRPGFALAKDVGERVRGDGAIRVVILARHGLVTWGDTAEQAYRGTIDAINRAAAFVNDRVGGTPRFGGRLSHAHAFDDAGRASLLQQMLPPLRGAVSSERSKVLTVDTSSPALELAAAAKTADVVAIGAACPDHLVHTGRVPLWIPFDPSTEGAATLVERIRAKAADHRRAYRAYAAECMDGDGSPGDPDARVIVIQHVGVITAGATVAASRLTRDLYRRAIEVMAGAQALGGFVSLTAAESLAVEYWPLERYKLSLAPPPGELAGKVALVSGAAGGIGRAIAEALAAAGACVAAFDLDADGARATVDPFGEAGVWIAGDVTSEHDVHAAFAAAVERFGGVDIVVSNAGFAASAPIAETSVDDWNRIHATLGTGYFLVARAAFEVLSAQRTGGSVVFIGSKNAMAPGRDASAYSSAKAAELHLARSLANEGGSLGIRVNTVNPDAVLRGSGIWDSRWREERAAAHGIGTDELEEYYRKRTALGVNILPEDIAQAVLHFASPVRSGKSTGNMLNVDGGVAAAYPR